MNLPQHFTLIAQDDAPAPARPKGTRPPGLMDYLPMILLMFAMFYFVLIRPQRKQQKALAEMRNRLGNGDKVMTAGGIHGIVTGQSKTTVSVKVAEGISIKFDRNSIQQVLMSKGEGVAAEDLPDDEPDEAEKS